MDQDNLKKSRQYLRQKNYRAVVRLLEPQIFRFRDSDIYYLYLGMSCLCTKDLQGAFTYLKRADQLNPFYPDTLICLALTYIKRNQWSEAIRCLLDITEKDPKASAARKLLKMLRKAASEGQTQIELDERKLARLIPHLGLHKARNILIIGAVVLVGILGASVFLFAPPLLADLVFAGLKGSPERKALVYKLTDIDKESVRTEDFVFSFPEKELKEKLDALTMMFLVEKDNLAQKLINEILLSDAPEKIKNKVRLIELNLAIPSFANFIDNFVYEDVKENPALYQNCYVAWSGLTDHVINTTTSKVEFDLLIGYQDKQIVEGRVKCILTFAHQLQAQMPIEVLGRVSSTGGSIEYLEVVSIHNLY